MNYKYEKVRETRSAVQAREAVTEKSKSSDKALSLSLDKKKIQQCCQNNFHTYLCFHYALPATMDGVFKL